MRNFINRIGKLVVFMAPAMLGGFFVSAQSGTTGHETVKGEVNFTDLAHYESIHPPAFYLHDLENEADEDVHIVKPPVSDPTLIKYAATPSSYSPLSLTPTALIPSPAPIDTFESTLDGGGNIPPDTHGGVDANYCVTAINQGIHIQTRAGANVSSVSLDAFWASVLPGGGTFDPRVHYDPTSGRWIMVTVAGANNTPTVTTLLLGVSKTGDPTGGWWLYNISAYPAGGYWLDFPDVGFNNKWITVTGNLFQNSPGTGYNGCKVFIFDKATVLTGSAAPFTQFTQASSECITPAITYDAAEQSLFCVENWDGSASGGGQMQLWKITGAVGTEAMTSVSFPASSGFKWQSTSYNVTTGGGGDFAPQTGTSNKIQTNDDRVTHVVFQNKKLWFAHNVFLPFSTTVDAARCSVQWWQIDTTGTPLQIGLVDDATNTNFYAFPSIAVNNNDDALLGFTHFATNMHPTATYMLHAHTDPVDTMEAMVDYRHGTATYYKTFSGTRDRWGDYSATAVDPVNGIDFWTIQEASASPANTWDTWWAYVKPCNLPTATVTPSGPTVFCTGGSVTLSASTGTGYAYQWNLGGVPVSGATNATYVASATGAYTVLITVSTCTSTSAATNVTVNVTPAAVITAAGPTGLCPGGSVLLNAATGAGYTYQWQLGGSNIAGATASSYTAPSTAPGDYTVVVTNSVGGCSATSTSVTVTVGSGPGAAVTASGPTSFCTPGSVTLNTTAATGLAYQWYSGSSPISGATNASFTATSSGSYYVIVTNTSGGCSSTSVTTTVSASAPPAAISGTLTVCTGATTPLSDPSSGGVWSSGATVIATVSSSGVVSGVGAGTATIYYTIGGACSTSAVVTVNTVSAALVAGPSIICIGGSATMADLTPGGVWSSSSSAASIGASTGVVSGVSAGTATISYTVTNSCGTAVATKAVTVSGTPASVAPITGSFSICNGGTTTLSDATPSGTWASSNTAVATISPTGFVTTTGIGSTLISYNVTGGTGCVSSATATVNVFSAVTAILTPAGDTTFCSGGSVVLNASTGTGYSYLWKKGGITISGATSPAYLANTTGLYTVVISEGSGCTATSNSVTVTVTSGTIVVPTVSVMASPGTTLCLSASLVSFTASSTHGGTPPVYQWFVNGISSGAGSTYAYTPAAGDVVTCQLTSNETCAFPSVLSTSDTIVISPLQTAAVSLTASPAGTVCPATTITFAAAPVYGGTAPSYQWTKNGSIVGTGPTYGYYPPHTGDVIKCNMTSSYPCLVSTAPVTSAPFTVSVATPSTNTVYIYVTPDSVIAPGQSVTFVATPTSGGTAPSYQWYISGSAVPGATAATFTISTLHNGDVVACKEVSSDPCAAPHTATSRGILMQVGATGIQQPAGNSPGLTLTPNPTHGEFMIQGRIANPADERLTIHITDMGGKDVYTKTIGIPGGNVSEQVILGRNIANGTYLVNLTSGDTHEVYHIVLER